MPEKRPIFRILLHKNLVGCTKFRIFASFQTKKAAMTTKIQIKDHLAEYFRRKYWSEELQAVRFPLSTFVRVKILNAIRRRPRNAPVDKGNFEFLVPCSSDYPEKRDTTSWNWIPPEKVAGGHKRPGIERTMEDEMLTDLGDYWYRYKYYGLPLQDAIEDFIDIYGLSVSPDTLCKAFTRWQDRTRHVKKTREYTKIRRRLKQTARK